MEKETVKVKFENDTNPKSAFDLIQLEELLQREQLDHNPENLHRVEFYVLLLITEGQGYHTIDFTDYKYEKGTLLTIRKDQIQKFFRGTASKGYILLFTDEFLISYLEEQENQKSIQLFNELLGNPKIQLSQNDFKSIIAGIHRIESEYQDLSDEFSLGIIRSELHILITKLYRIKSKSEKIILDKKYLAEFIEFQKLVEDKITQTNRVADYAHMMGISTKTLNTISKSIIHKSAKQFLDDIYIKQIKRILINTSLSIKEIAFSTGFEETTNFYKYFKRQVGYTPEQFRTNYLY